MDLTVEFWFVGNNPRYTKFEKYLNKRSDVPTFIIGDYEKKNPIHKARPFLKLGGMWKVSLTGYVPVVDKEFYEVVKLIEKEDREYEEA